MSVDSEIMPNGHLARGHTEIRFRDQYGDERVIHRQRGQALRVKKKDDSVSHLLNRSAAILMGQRIKAEREAAGLTLEQLFERSGLAAPGYGKQRMYVIENGGSTERRQKQGVRFGTLYAIALALGVAPQDLMPSAKDVAKHAGVDLVTPKPRLGKK
jgi:hypothetical protein